ncbi:MAG: 1-acyl-sn-glycerol-3-phosphate acyltransferase [Bacteroidia bacterium]
MLFTLKDRLTRALLRLWLSGARYVCFSDSEWYGTLPKSGQSVLLLANHISWWDGIWVFLQNEKLWKRSFHALMLENELQKRPFLRTLGGIPLSKGRQMTQCVEDLRHFLKTPDGLLLIFPESEIKSTQEFKHHFKLGLVKRIYSEAGHICLLFQGVEYANRPRPISFHFVKTITLAEVDGIEQVYHDFVMDSRKIIAQRVLAINQA